MPQDDLADDLHRNARPGRIRGRMASQIMWPRMDPPAQRCLICPLAKAKDRQMREEIHLEQIFSQALIEAQGIAALLLDEHQDIVYSQGDLTPYISFPSGEIGSSLKNIYDLPKVDPCPG